MSTIAPAAMMNGTTESPNGVIFVPLTVSAPVGVISPHELLLRTPKTTRPRPRADSATPGMSSFSVLTAGESLMCLIPKARMPTTTTVSPAKTTRQVRALVTNPPISGPAATAAPAMPPRSPYASARSLPV